MILPRQSPHSKTYDNLIQIIFDKIMNENDIKVYSELTDQLRNGLYLAMLSNEAKLSSIVRNV